jgi:hypothetical protein
MGEEEGGRADPPRPESRTLIWTIILAAIAISAAIIAVPFIQEALKQPNITLTDKAQAILPCAFSSSQQFFFSFNLINTGEADGFVTVAVMVDGAIGSEDTFYVPRGTSVPGAVSHTVNDCNNHSVDVRITGVRRA